MPYKNCASGGVRRDVGEAYSANLLFPGAERNLFPGLTNNAP